jgi:putative hydrolase of the HAD superfamily
MAAVRDFDGFIFDYGGVLVAHQTDEDQARMAEIAGLPVELFTERYWTERPDYDLGLRSNVEYWTAVVSNNGKGKPLAEEQIARLTEYDTQSWMRYDQSMWDWVEELRRGGKRVAMLSNMPLDLGQALKTQTDKLDKFDNVTLSYEVRSAKPEPAIYEQCLEALGTEPARTLFLDDRLPNVQGAEMLGIRALQFTSADDLLLRLLG